MSSILRRFARDQRGYTLIVAAALFAAFAATMAAYLDRNVVTQQLDRQATTQAQMARLQSAIEQYHYYLGRYPCPARQDLITTDSTFGEAVANCHTGTPSGITVLTGASSEVIRGMVPVRALAPYGIDIGDAFDPWNSRIMYVVNRNLTPSGSGSASARPTVTQVTLNMTLPSPNFLLISYGRDRRGAYQRSQPSASLTSGPATACSGAELRSENCGTDTVFKIASAFTASTASTANYYDDIVTMKASSAVAGTSCAATTITGYQSPRVWAAQTPLAQTPTLNVCTVAGGLTSGQGFSVTTDVRGSSWIAPSGNTIHIWNLTEGVAASPTYNTRGAENKNTKVDLVYDGACSVYAKAQYFSRSSNYKYAQVEIVQVDTCVVNGGWSSWGNYMCDAACSESGTMTRYRTCTYPSPKNGGTACTGSSSESNGVACTGDTYCGDETIDDCYSGCFISEVMVTMADGSKKRIDQLAVGDVVLGQTRTNTVLNPATHDTGEPLYGFNGGKAFVTGGHPFWTTDGWKAVVPELTPKEYHGITTTKLMVGDELFLEDGEKLALTSIEQHAQPSRAVYNPMLDGDHTYYANGMLVHNKPMCDSMDPGGPVVMQDTMQAY